eukprot:TRINITY_DN49231_c0_g1_i1.p1 TRINITY_DN49231_c0_g1~~TRINITY_DN49231_c0_g1_i1.p1  ORF type:complete len:520 (-),score=150.87 TRINITY_DN49231_c0_g1_i1:259-1818(-)
MISSYMIYFYVNQWYFLLCFYIFFFFKQKTAYEMLRSLVGSEMCIRDRVSTQSTGISPVGMEAVSPQNLREAKSVIDDLTDRLEASNKDRMELNALVKWHQTLMDNSAPNAEKVEEMGRLSNLAMSKARAAKKDLTSCQKELAAAQQELVQLKEEGGSRLDGEVEAELRATIDHLQAKLRNRDKIMNAFKEQLATRSELIDQDQSNVGELRARVRSMETDLERTRGELEAARSKIRTLQATPRPSGSGPSGKVRHQESVDRIRQLQSLVEAQRQENSQLMRKCSQLQAAARERDTQPLMPLSPGSSRPARPVDPAVLARVSALTESISEQLPNQGGGGGTELFGSNSTLPEHEVLELAGVLEAASTELQAKANTLAQLTATSQATQSRLEGRIGQLERERNQLSDRNRMLEVENLVAIEQLSNNVHQPLVLSQSRSTSGHLPSNDKSTGTKESISIKVESLRQQFRRNGVELPLTHMKNDTYRLGANRKVTLSVQRGKLHVRVGTGHCDLIDYIEKVDF